MASQSVFNTVKDQIIFNGGILRAYVPKRYENVGLLVFGQHPTVFGIIELEYTTTLKKEYKKEDFIYKGLLLPCMFETAPTSVRNATRRGVDSYLFEYEKGASFMLHNRLMQQTTLADTSFNEMIALGNIPKFLSYDQTAFLFDRIIDITKVNINVEHAIFELIYSYLYRDPDTGKQYRLSDMKKTPKFVQLRSITDAPATTSAKLYGSYATDGLTSALVTETTELTRLEQHLRS